jgi:hypothetical protein
MKADSTLISIAADLDTFARFYADEVKQEYAFALQYGSEEDAAEVAADLMKLRCDA